MRNFVLWRGRAERGSDNRTNGSPEGHYSAPSRKAWNCHLTRSRPNAGAKACAETHDHGCAKLRMAKLALWLVVLTAMGFLAGAFLIIS
jgi:hypothetical protein